MTLELPERFVLVFEGKLWRVCQRANIVPNELPHLIGQLLCGRCTTTEGFAAHGLRVTVEECTDQGNDEPDQLAIRRPRTVTPPITDD